MKKLSSEALLENWFCLAGYENCWPALLATYEIRINIHLAYLPEFQGLMVLRMLGMQVLTSLA